MDAANSLSGEELTVKLEKVFQVFADHQEDWAMENSQEKTQVIWRNTPVFKANTALKPGI